MTTLQDLLDLLQDNDTGDIGADDLRTIVTTLWNRVTSVSREPYKYTTGAVGAGQITIDSWAVGPANLTVSDTTRDSSVTPSLTLESGPFRLVRNDGQGEVRGDITTNGSMNVSIAVTVTEVVGTAPGNNADMTLISFFELDLS